MKNNQKNDIKNDTSVAQRIVSNDEMQITFDQPVMWRDPSTGRDEVLYTDGGSGFGFKIDGTYSDTSNSVRLKHGSNSYVLTFTKSTINQRQSNNAFWVVNTDGTINTSKTTWSGMINNYRNN